MMIIKCMFWWSPVVSADLNPNRLMLLWSGGQQGLDVQKTNKSYPDI